MPFFLGGGMRRAACGILVPQPGIDPAPPALEACNLNHWTTREVPRIAILDTPTAASYKWVLWGFGVGWIYGQGSQRGGNSVRVLGASSLAWGGEETLAGCSLVKGSVSIFCKCLTSPLVLKFHFPEDPRMRFSILYPLVPFKIEIFSLLSKIPYPAPGLSMPSAPGNWRIPPELQTNRFTCLLHISTWKSTRPLKLKMVKIWFIFFSTIQDIVNLVLPYLPHLLSPPRSKLP